MEKRVYTEARPDETCPLVDEMDTDFFLTQGLRHYAGVIWKEFLEICPAHRLGPMAGFHIFLGTCVWNLYQEREEGT